MPSLTSWDIAPSPLSLNNNEIHLWRALLGCDASVLSRLKPHLSADELARAARFVFPRDRDHFSAARGILRELLAAYLNCQPAEIEFVYGERGKPSLGGAHSGDSLRFNLSHAHGLAVYAFARKRDVGVDVEAIRPDVASDNIAERFFSLQEAAELQSLPAELRERGFFLCWTRKEAYIKARGDGLGIPLDSFCVTLTPGLPEKLTSADSSRWKLHSFDPGEGYAGALIGEGKDWEPRHWQWSP